MSNDQPSDAHKQAGNEHFAAKRFKEALESYTSAIELDPENAVLYSNRSGTHSALKQYKEALADAEQCIALKRAWGKGYGRQGDALFGMGQYDQAIEAYKNGLIFDPSATNLKAKVADCEKAKGGNSTGKLPFFKRLVLYFQITLHSAIVMTAILGSIPFIGSVQNAAFGMCVKMTLMAQAVALANNHGMIKFNMEYFQRVVFDEDAHYLFGALLFLIATPNMITNLPQAIRSMLFIATALQAVVPSVLPMMWGLFKGPVLKITGMRADIYSFCASLEVMTVFVLMFEMLTPARNILLVIMYWQFLRFRYMLSPGTKVAFAGVRSTVDGVVNASWCPGMVKGAWNKLCTVVYSFADPEQQAQAGSGLASKCSVM